MFKPGDKVVCINDNEDATILYRLDGNYRVGLDGLKIGTVYTVRSTYVDTQGIENYCIRVNEISRGITPKQGVEAGFASFRFVPYIPTTVDRELEAV